MNILELDVYKNIKEYNPGKKTKVLIVFDYMIADMIGNKKLYQVFSELSIREWKLNTSLVVCTQSYFPLSKYVRLNTIHFFIMKIQNRKEFQQIAINNLSVTGFNKLEKLYIKCSRAIFIFIH